MSSAPLSADGFPALCDGVSLKILENPFLYKRSTDELYELDEAAFAALSSCDGQNTIEATGLDAEFLSYCLAEGLIELHASPREAPPEISGPSPLPSLRYLELQVTRRCNLACRHCYLGDARPVDMTPDEFSSVVKDFSSIGGLRLLVSGGEPLAHPAWRELNERLAGSSLRRVLLTNGVALTREVLAELNFDEVQVSLDGLAEGHDYLRGAGSFAAAVKAAMMVGEAGLALSVATQVHSRNLTEFDALAKLVAELGAGEWGIDAPCVSGRLAANPGLAVSPCEAALAMAHAFGGAYHGGGGGASCGHHLMTVGADGIAARCGFYFATPLGKASEGLAVCWGRKYAPALADIAGCSTCAVAEECGGGCRYRAGGELSPDLVMCAAFGVNPRLS